jgi:hypothetical protein
MPAAVMAQHREAAFFHEASQEALQHQHEDSPRQTPDRNCGESSFSEKIMLPNTLMPRTRGPRTHSGKLNRERRLQKRYRNHTLADVPLIPKFAQELLPDIANLGDTSA